MAGDFHTVQCPDCENEQIVFSKASTAVSCAVCGTTLGRPTGGKAALEGEVVDTVEQRSTGAQTQSGGTAGAR